jgi:hypothetical protein
VKVDGYAREKVGLAADALKGGKNNKDKLLKVAGSTLSAVSAKDFADSELRLRWEAIYSALTQKGKYSESVGAMTEAEAASIVEMIVALDRLIGDDD